MFVFTSLSERLHHLSSIVQSNTSIPVISSSRVELSIFALFPALLGLSQLWSSLNVVHCTGHRCCLCTLYTAHGRHWTPTLATCWEREMTLLAPELFLITLIRQHSALTEPLSSHSSTRVTTNRKILSLKIDCNVRRPSVMGYLSHCNRIKCIIDFQHIIT